MTPPRWRLILNGKSAGDDALRDAVTMMRERIDACGRAIRLEVDGGVKPDNIARIAKAGADTFVAGSAIFGHADYAKVVGEMRAAVAAVR